MTPEERFNQHYPLAVRQAKKFIGSLKLFDMEEAFESAALFGLWKAALYHEPERGSQFCTCAYRFIENELIQELRAVRKGLRSVREPSGYGQVVGHRAWADGDESEIWEEVQPHPDETVHRKQVFRLVEKLPARTREMIRLFYFEDVEQPEIGRRFGLARPSVGSAILRALQKVREEWEEINDPPRKVANG